MIKPVRTEEETRGAILEQFWDDLAKMDINDVAKRSQAIVDNENLRLTVIGQPLLINHRDKTITNVNDNFPVSREITFVTLKYLLGAQDLSLSGKLVNPLEFVGGELYFRSHSFKLGPLEEKFTQEPNGFLVAGKKLDAFPQKMGDAAFTITILPRIPITFVLWCADEEFPASIKVLFDTSAEKHISLGVMLGIVNLTAKRLVEQVV